MFWSRMAFWFFGEKRPPVLERGTGGGRGGRRGGAGGGGRGPPPPQPGGDRAAEVPARGAGPPAADATSSTAAVQRDRRDPRARLGLVERDGDLDLLARLDGGLGRLRDRPAVPLDLDLQVVDELLPVLDLRGDEPAAGGGGRHPRGAGVRVRVS